MRRIVLTLGSSRVRLAVGVVLVGILFTQILLSFEGKTAKGRATASAVCDVFTLDDGSVTSPEGKRLEELARTDHVALLERCLANYHRTVKQYTCTLTKNERLGVLGGKMTGDQVIDIRFKEDPFSVMMTWRVGARGGDKLLYVERDPADPNASPIYIHPVLPFKFIDIPSVERRPDDPEVRSSSLRSVTEFGFARSMESLLAVYRQAAEAGHLDADYLGAGTIDGRKTFALKRTLPPGHDYPAKTTIIEIDQEYLVPVRVSGTDWQDQDLCHYRYTNVRFDANLTDDDFTRKSNGM